MSEAMLLSESLISDVISKIIYLKYVPRRHVTSFIFPFQNHWFDVNVLKSRILNILTKNRAINEKWLPHKHILITLKVKLNFFLNLIHFTKQNQ